ncbi:hypothetical protein EST38_g5173 [Candolleomyces aberdarensis]|uniref:Uncharacterized protein n=1 Tax=Candolleomyces aberdarensis TaxID=2316362 RepID=A0A4Q2DL47_9AGAR|nr:hypothetical protein EST38_g5173 [Candolleomyces aberdarensis]
MASYFQILFKSTSPGHWLELSRASDENWKNLVGNVSTGIIFVIGDALLVYRCYIVCMEYWWMAILPMITSLSGIVLFFMQRYKDASDSDTHRYSTAFTRLIVSTNVVVTTLITFRLLRARRTLAKFLPSADATLYTGVIAILIESAAPLTIFGIAKAILENLWVPVPRRSSGFIVCVYVSQGLFYSFCALSPHMIIFRITTGRSFTKFPSPKDGVPTNPIQFAHRTAESTILQSTLNRKFDRSRDADTEQELSASIGELTQTQSSIIHIAQEKQTDDGDVEEVA